MSATATLLCRSERYLDLDRDTRRWVEAEGIARGVVARNGGDAGIELGDVKGRLGPPERIRLLTTHETRRRASQTCFYGPTPALEGAVPVPGEPAKGIGLCLRSPC